MRIRASWIRTEVARGLALRGRLKIVPGHALPADLAAGGNKVAVASGGAVLGTTERKAG